MNPSVELQEVWRAVPGWEGVYEASSFGRIRSLGRIVQRGGRDMRVREKILAPNVHHSGYLRVNLSHNGRRSEQLVHWIVAATFHGERPLGMEIRHLDGDQTNNAAANLRYGTSRENKNDIKDHGTHAMRARTHCPFGHPLVGSNLVKSEARRGHRKCRACNSAHARAHRNELRGQTLKQAADQYYIEYTMAPLTHHRLERTT